MKCPVCNNEMVEEDFGGVMVDVCKNGCKGIWFDWFELSKLDEKDEGFGKALEEAINSPRVNDSDRGQINCPKCNKTMHIHKYKSAKEVNVDECYQCAGFFLDSGELGAIRENFMSEEESEQYCKSLLNNIPEYSKAEAELEKEKLRAAAIEKYTRFLRISSFFRK